MDIVSTILMIKKVKIITLHRKLTIEERTDEWNKFLNGHTLMAISTDVVARAVDVPDVKIIINFDLPYNVATRQVDTKSYRFRIGRTSRFGKFY